MNLNVNNFFGPNRGNRRWTVLLSPAVYAQHFSTELINKADKSPLSGKKTDKVEHRDRGRCVFAL